MWLGVSVPAVRETIAREENMAALFESVVRRIVHIVEIG
jgi:hypothetical protein